MPEYKGGDVVLVTYSVVTDGRCLTDEEAATLNAGGNPFGIDLTGVQYPDGPVHFFPNCGDDGDKGLARTIQATTCSACLLRRARVLTGWRWTHEHNNSEVAHLKKKLGDQVAGFESRPAQDGTVWRPSHG